MLVGVDLDGMCLDVFVCLSTCLGVWMFGNACMCDSVYWSGQGVRMGVLIIGTCTMYVSMREQACAHTRVCSAPPPPSSFMTSSLGLMLWVNKI